MEPLYMNDRGIAKVGNIVMMPGYVRGVVIAVKGTFVRIRAFGYKDTGEKVWLNFVHDFPASQCVFLGETDPDIRIMKTGEQKAEEVRQTAADLKDRALRLGMAEPFVSWVLDADGGLLILDVDGPVDTSQVRKLSWDSDKFTVQVFSIPRRFPISCEVHF